MATKRTYVEAISTEEEERLTLIRAKKLVKREDRRIQEDTEKRFEAITNSLSEKLDEIKAKVGGKGRPHSLANLLPILDKITPKRIVEASLYQLFASMSNQETYHSTVNAIGHGIATVALDDELLSEFPDRVKLGELGLLFEVSLKEALPELFTTEGTKDKRWEVTGDTGDMVADTAKKNPVFLPTFIPPVPWSAWNVGGPHRLQTPILKHSKKGQKRRLSYDTPAIKGLNALQAVGYQINPFILAVQEAILRDDMPTPVIPSLDGVDPKDKALFVKKYLERKALINKKQKIEGNNISVGMDMSTAQCLVGKTFYTPMNFDNRGRVYALTQFNYQRDDRVRSLFLFAEGSKLSSEGLDRLYIHAANCWASRASDADKRKTDKLPMDERIQWTIDHLDQILSVARDPLNDLWWQKADKKTCWQFLAVCNEIYKARLDADYVCCLPVGYDGSCSGLQHLSMMMRSEKDAPKVNVVASDKPQDVYQMACDRMIELIRNPNLDIEDPEKTAHVLALCLEHEVITRGFCKRGTMTYSYSSQARGMAEQLQEEYFDKEETGAQEIFEDLSKGNPSYAARVLGRYLYEAIAGRGGVVEECGRAMTYMKELATAMAKVDLGVEWTTPCGLPFHNVYRDLEVKRITLNVGGKRHELSFAIGDDEQSDIRVEKCGNAISPNVVHSCDASHLIFAVIGCAEAGITLTTVHDCFACLPEHAGRMNKILRDTLVDMYANNDVLQSLYDACRNQLDKAGIDTVLPHPPAKGILDINSVRESIYAFA